MVTAIKPDGSRSAFAAIVRIDTPGEADYYRHGGILQYVLRSLAERPTGPSKDDLDNLQVGTHTLGDVDGDPMDHSGPVAGL
jgi:hypothetical protein